MSTTFTITDEQRADLIDELWDDFWTENDGTRLFDDGEDCLFLNWFNCRGTNWEDPSEPDAPRGWPAFRAAGLKANGVEL